MPISLSTGVEIGIKNAGGGAPPRPPTTCTWSGLGANDNWSTSANWDILPVDGDSLVFAGTTRLTPNNDLTADTSFKDISFASNCGAFVIGGNRLVMTGDLSSESLAGAIRLDFDIVINSAILNLLDPNNNAQSLRLTGEISESGGSREISKSGGFTVYIASSPNLFTGGVTIEAGTIYVNRNEDAALGTGLLTLDSGTLWNNGAHISNGVDVTINGGLFSLDNGFGSEMSGDLDIAGTLTIFVWYSDQLLSGVISGAGNINTGEIAGGVLVISGTNTFSGLLSSHFCPVKVTGSMSASTINVEESGLLYGTGVCGTVTVQNQASARIQGGTGGAQNLTVGALTLFGVDSEILVNTNGSTAVSAITAGAVTLGGAVVHFNPAQNLNAGTYTLISGSSMSGSIVQGTLPIGRTWVSLGIVGNDLIAVLS